VITAYTTARRCSAYRQSACLAVIRRRQLLLLQPAAAAAAAAKSFKQNLPGHSADGVVVFGKSVTLFVYFNPSMYAR